MSRERPSSDVVDAAEFVRNKLQWQLVLLCDTSLSTSARLFGALVMHDFDVRKGGYAWRSQKLVVAEGESEDTYRTRTGFSVRTIQLAARELEENGYIRLERGKGRGNSNHYWPIFEKANPASPFTEPEKANPVSPFSDEKAKISAVKGEAGFALSLKEPDKGSPDTSARESREAFDRASKRWAEVAPDRIAPPLDWRAWQEALAAGATPDELERAVLRYLATSDDVRRQRVPRLALWLTQERWRGYLAEAVAVEAKAATLAVDCPPWIRDLVSDRKGEAYVASWLAGCRWDGARFTLLTRTGLGADKLRADLGAELAAAGVATIAKMETVV